MSAKIDLEGVIQALRDSKISGEISWFYDGLWTVRLGDPADAINAEETFDNLDDAVRGLVDMAGDLYPGSQFAKRFVR